MILVIRCVLRGSLHWYRILKVDLSTVSFNYDSPDSEKSFTIRTLLWQSTIVTPTARKWIQQIFRTVQFNWKENHHTYIVSSRKFDHGFQSYFESNFDLVSYLGSCSTHPKYPAECDSCLRSSSHSMNWKPADNDKLPSRVVCEVSCTTFRSNARLHNNANKTCLIEDHPPRALVKNKWRIKKWPTCLFILKLK